MSGYKRILVPVDFSEVSVQAAARAAELAGYYGAGLVFLHVVEHFPEHLPHYQMSGEGKDPEQFIVDRAEQDLKGLCHRLGLDEAVRAVRLTGHSAKSEILKFAEDESVDLLVIGSRGRNPLTKLLAGSTATGVARAAKCDVFIVQGAQ